MCAQEDSQHIFYSVDRDENLGTYWEDGYEHPLADDAFFKAGFSFQDVPDGWHHVAAVAEGERTCFYLDAEPVGTIGFALHEDIAFIGNVAPAAGGTQPWGLMADFRLFERALSHRELQLVMQSGLSSVGPGFVLPRQITLHVEPIRATESIADKQRKDSASFE